jgi:hypothetical protein
MKYRAQSADVLNSADNMTRQLDWMLFVQNQDKQLFGENPYTDWVPGVALYPKPKRSELFDGRGCYIRPMFEVLEYGGKMLREAARCKDCDVSWKGSDPCFVCGESVEPETFIICPKSLVDIANNVEADLANELSRMVQDAYLSRPGGC